MPNPLDTIRTLLRKPQPTTEQLAATVSTAASADENARGDVDRLAAKVQAGFLDDEKTRAADRAALAAARETAGDAADLLTEARKRHATAVEADEQARRLGLYTSAKARADEAAADLARAYPAVVKAALKMLRTLAEAQHDVQTANAQLPAGLPAIDDPEHVVRARAYQPTEILSETETVLWTRHDMATPVPEPFQSEIQEARGGWGAHPGRVDEVGRMVVMPDVDPSYLRVRYLRREVRQPVTGLTPAPLAVALRLPALQGDGQAWGAPDMEGSLSPVVLAAMAGHAFPDVVLGKLHKLDATPAKPKALELDVTVEWHMLGYVDAIPLQPALTSYHSTADENPERQSDSNPRPIGSDLVGLPGMSIPGTGIPVRPRFGDSPVTGDVRH